MRLCFLIFGECCSDVGRERGADGTHHSGAHERRHFQVVDLLLLLLPTSASSILIFFKVFAVVSLCMFDTCA